MNRRDGRPATQIEWKQAYAWILVGGQAMDRGYTVRELSVTYMPRPPGVGNADTLQQRARFLGYKQRYFGHCRIHLEADVRNALEAYVEHEEEMRSELLALQNSGSPLPDWRRRFVLDPALRPCRNNVIQHSFISGNYEDDWYHNKQLVLPPELVSSNNAVVDHFMRDIPFRPDQAYPSNQAAQQHLVAEEVPLRDVVENLLLGFKLQGVEDSVNMLGLLLQLKISLERAADETARVYAMRPTYSSERTVDRQGRLSDIRRVHQGPTKVGTGYTYPGDRAFFDQDRITLQIHWFNPTSSPNGSVLAEHVPVLATWVPRRFGMGWIAQHQPDQ